jgi:hypothetical protein
MTYDPHTLFAPRNESMSRDQIWGFFFDTCTDELSEKPYVECVVDKKRYDVPKFNPDEIPDNLCQEFVEGEHAIDETYSEPMQYTFELAKFVKDAYKKIMKAVKKDRIVAVRAEKKAAKQLEKELKKFKDVEAKKLAKEQKAAAKKSKKAK